MWLEHIEDYSENRKKDAKRVEGILIKGGWDSSTYKSRMKKDLFRYLDDWYTLSIKTLPVPATLRRNPSRLLEETLHTGWRARELCFHDSVAVEEDILDGNAYYAETCEDCGKTIAGGNYPIWDYYEAY